MIARHPCQFSFEGTPPFAGYALGTVWNGFDNVAVTPETARQIADYFRSLGDHDTAEDLASIQPDGTGLISLAGGYATRIVTPE